MSRPSVFGSVERYMQRGKGRRMLLAAIAVAVVLAAPSYATSGYHLDIARLAIYTAGLTATWSLLAGIAGQISFMHVTFAGLAAYAGAIWARNFSSTVPGLDGPWASIIVGTLFSWALGTALGVVLLRLRGAYLALFTLALAEMVRVVVLSEVDFTGGPLTLQTEPLPGGATVQYYILVATLMLVMVVTYALIRSRFGLFIRAMREDVDAAAAMGVRTTRLKILVFSLTALMAGLIGGVYFHTVPRVSPTNIDQLQMGLIVIYATVAGLESPVAGAISGIAFVVLLEGLRVISIGDLRVEPGIWRYAMFGAFFIITLRLVPDGFINPILRKLAGQQRTVGKSEHDRSRMTAATRAAAPGSIDRDINLSAHNIEMYFGGLKALDGVSLQVVGPQICGLIGPNGAGKTTLLNVISGYLRPSAGAVLMRGQRIDGLPPYEVVQRGIGRTFQITRSFRRLTVIENLLVPGLVVEGEEMNELTHEGRALEALRVVGLERLAFTEARALSGGQQKLLELARLLMLDTAVLLLDEPFAGVHPRLKASIAQVIRTLRDEGRAVILVEHDLSSVFSLCDRIVVLAQGRVIADGGPDAIRTNADVIDAYLGTKTLARAARTRPGSHVPLERP